MATLASDLESSIRTIPDYPRPGIIFRDITTLLGDPRAFRRAVDELVHPWAGSKIDKVAGIEARGFITATALALKLGCGLLLIRKDGKLPGETIAEDYVLEYGTDRLTMHIDACTPGAKVLIADDLVATGGTALAAARLIRRAGGEVTGARFLIDLRGLGGSDRLSGAGIDTRSLLTFEGD